MTKTPLGIKGYVYLAELAVRLGVSERKLRRMLKEARLPPPLRLGRVVVWRLEEIEEWETSTRPGPPAEQQ